MMDDRKKKMKKKKRLKRLKKPLKDPRFNFDISEVFEHDIPNMKPPSHLDVLRNDSLLKANLPNLTEPKSVSRIRYNKMKPLLKSVDKANDTKSTTLRQKKRKKKKSARNEETLKIEENKSLASISAQLPYLKDVFIGDWTPSKEFMEETNKLFYKTTQKKLDRRKTTVAPDDQDEISKLKTGEDAVAFFSKAGKNTAVKFLYLNREGAYKGETSEDVKKREYKPYSLVVVPREKVNPEYFTMSASGVVHIQPKQPTEYMSLSDWMKESTMFKVLRRIRFFKFYLSYKTFKIWHRNSRFKNFCKRRAKLHRELFLSKKTFCEKLIELREECYKIEDEPIMNLSFNPKEGKNGAFTTELFELQQSKVRISSSDTFNSRKMDGSLQDLCKIVGSRTRLEGMETPTAIQFYLLGKDIPAEESKPISSIKKSKSMFQTQMEEMEKQLALEKAYREKMMLGDFIRLCDYMSIESYISLCKNTMINLFNEMKVDNLDPSAKRIMFSILIEFDLQSGSLKYTPTEEAMHKLFKDNSNGCIEVVQVKPLIKDKAFRNYFEEEDLKLNKWKIEDAIRKDEVYQYYNQLIYDLIKDSYIKTYEFGSKFEGLKREFKYVQNWKNDPIPFSEKKHDHQSFENALDYVEDRLVYLSKAQSKKDCDVFKTDSTGLKTFLEPELKSILSTIKKTVHISSYNLMYSLREELWSKIEILKQRPTLLPEFVDFLEKLKSISQEDRDLKDRYDEVKRIFLLSQSNRDRTRGTMSDLKIEGRLGNEELDPDELKEKLDENMMSFDKELKMANELKRERIQIQEDELDRCINKVEDKLAEHVRLLRSETFTSVVTDQTTPQILESLQVLGQEIEDTKEETERYNRFKYLISENEKLEWDNLAKVQNLYELRKDIWETLHRIETKTNKWMSIEVSNLQSDRINSIIQTTYEHVINEIKPKLKQQFKEQQNEMILLEEKKSSSTKEENKNKAVVLEEEEEEYKDAVVEDLLQLLNRWRKRKLVISDIGNKDLKPTHWQSIVEIIDNNSLVPQMSHELESNTLNRLEEMKIFDYADEIHEISLQASGEAFLRKKVEDIEKKWSVTEFTIKPYRDKKDLYILGSCEDIFDVLEEHLTSLTMMQGNEYISGVKPAVDKWEHDLNSMTEVIEEWLSVQRKWVYFEHIFDSDDLKKQLHIEASRFSVVNRKFTELLNFAYQNRNVKLNAMRKMGEDQNIPLVDYLKDCNELLDEIQQSLDLFLRTKRDHFPRFYFLSNDELLEILSQVKNQNLIQRHLKKCFENIEYVKFRKEGSRECVGVESVDGEYIRFEESLFAVTNIEFWLIAIQRELENTLKEKMRDTYQARDEVGRREWVQDEKLPAQCILAVDKIIWTREIEKSFHEIQSGDNPKALREYRDRFQSYVRLLVDMIRTKGITKHQKILLNNLILRNVHSLEVINKLIDKNCQSQKDFEWSIQLRYYFDENSAVLSVQQISGRFEYGYEYLGNSSRLVITPLTERCILTSTTALHSYLGTLFQGPSGVGKTETIKDFAKTLARYCVVFNCSERLDISMMRRLFTGFAQSGAWACLDEFNRIEVNVLSVVAQYMQIIQKALIAQLRNFIFESSEIRLSENYGIFITLNPVMESSDSNSIQNQSFSKLPDNLRAMFRPVSMMSPDESVICENILFSEGFSQPTVLAQRLVHLYKLSERQLSKQHHYDFGLRAMKAVLQMSTEFKKIVDSTSGTVATGKQQNAQQLKAKEESQILVRAIFESNVGKFLKNDKEIFSGIVNDFFPNTSLPKRPITSGVWGVTGLKTAVEGEMGKLKLRKKIEFVKKIVQLHKVMVQQTGIMVVGGIGVGKTTCIKLLAKACNNLSKRQIQMNVLKPVISSTVYPKAFSLEELFGVLNESEWQDGIISKLTRRAIHNEHSSLTSTDEVSTLSTNISTKDHQHWIILDGIIDGYWIENMNTALDDNKVLCLTNGERITVSNNIKYIFEVTDLSFASPSTISRCGMIVLQDHHLNEPWSCVLETWLEKFSDIVGDRITEQVKDLCEIFIADTLSHVRDDCEEMVPSIDLNLVESLCDLLDIMLVPEGLNIEKQTYSYYVKNDKYVAMDGRESDEMEINITEEKKENQEEIEGEGEGDSEKEIISEENKNQKKFILKTIIVQPMKIIKMNFIFAFVWSLGANINQQYRSSFDLHTKSLIEISKSEFPLEQTVYDYFVDLKTQSWKPWNDLLDEEKKSGDFFTNTKIITTSTGFLSSEKSKLSEGGRRAMEMKEKCFDELFVPTVESIRMEYLVDLITKKSKRRKNILISGPRGMGKTKLIEHYMSSKIDNEENFVYKHQEMVGVSSSSSSRTNIKKDGKEKSTKKTEENNMFPSSFGKSKYASSIIRISSSFDSPIFIKTLEELIPGKSKKLLGDIHGIKSVVFLENLNLIKSQNCETKVQPSLEFMREIICEDGFFDRKKLFFKKIVNTSFIGEVKPFSNTMNSKFTRHFHLLQFDDLSKKSIIDVYHSILESYFLKDFCEESKAYGSSTRIGNDESSGSIITTTMVAKQLEDILVASYELYSRIKEHLKPRPCSIHYCFNLRDLSSLFRGMLMINKEELRTSKEILWKLWIHESKRVFKDRLVSNIHKSWFDNCQKSEIRNFVSTEFMNITDFEKILFGSYLFRGENTNYDFIDFEDSDFLKEELDQHLQDYRLDNDLSTMDSSSSAATTTKASANTESSSSTTTTTATKDKLEEKETSGGSNFNPLISMGGIDDNYVFFDDAVRHLSSLCRILKQKRGNALLLGMDGSGRKTLTRLSCFILGLDCYEVNLNEVFGGSSSNSGISNSSEKNSGDMSVSSFLDKAKSFGVSVPSFGSSSTSSSKLESRQLNQQSSRFEIFKESMKNICLSIGCDERKYIVVLNDDQLSDKKILGGLDTLIKSGEMYDSFYSPDDMERILKEYGQRLKNSLSQNISASSKSTKLSAKSKRKEEKEKSSEEVEGEGEENGEDKEDQEEDEELGFEKNEEKKRLEKLKAFSEKKNKIIVSKKLILKSFRKKILNSLHFVFIMSHLPKEKFNSRIEEFPFLLKNCSIEYYNKWPSSALIKITKSYLLDEESPSSGSESSSSSSSIRKSDDDSNIFKDIAKANIIPNFNDLNNLISLCVRIHQIVEEQLNYLKTKKNQLSYFFVTPTLFVEMLEKYERLVSLKKDELEKEKMKYLLGIKTMKEANLEIKKLKKRLDELKPKLKDELTSKTMLREKLVEEKKKQDKIKRKVELEEKDFENQVNDSQEMGNQYKLEIERMMPLYKASIEALESINPNDIFEIRHLGNPPSGVRLVMEAICLLFNKKQNWEESQVLLKDSKFINNLVNFNKEDVDDSILKKLNLKYLKNPNFSQHEISKHSEAAVSLLVWVNAIYKFSTQHKILQPKLKEYEESKLILEENTKKLENQKLKLQKINEQIEELQIQHNDLQVKFETIKEIIEKNEKRIERSDELVVGLGHETTRWEAKVTRLNTKLSNVLGDMLFSSAFLTYLGPFDEKNRTNIIRLWIENFKSYKISFSEFDNNSSYYADFGLSEEKEENSEKAEKLSGSEVLKKEIENSKKKKSESKEENENEELIKSIAQKIHKKSPAEEKRIYEKTINEMLRNCLITDDLEIEEWFQKGLPNDEFSIQNAVIVNQRFYVKLSSSYSKSKTKKFGKKKDFDKWPLLIDPEGQATQWIYNTEQHRRVKLIKASHPDIMKHLESSVQLGIPTLIEDIDEKTLDFRFSSILKKKTKHKKGRRIIKIGDKEIDYNEGFRLYLATRLTNPNFHPSICLKVNIINFGITEKGLQEQLLNSVVDYERPELQRERLTYLRNINNHKKKLKLTDLEILQKLSKVQDENYEPKEKTLEEIEDNENNKKLFKMEKIDAKILDDKELIISLSKSKKESSILIKDIRNAAKNASQLSNQRKSYFEIVQRASIVYFTMRQLKAINCMYQNSLQFFGWVFTKCLKDYSMHNSSLLSSSSKISKKSSSKLTPQDERAEKMKNFLTYKLFRYICRGIFEQDRLLFSFILSIRILQKSKIINSKEITFFLIGPTSLILKEEKANLMFEDDGEKEEEDDGEKEKKKKKKKTKCFSNKQYNELLMLEKTFPKSFGGLLVSTKTCDSAWKEFMDNTDSNTFNFPTIIKDRYSEWRKLLLIKILKPEKLIFAVKNFVKMYLGKEYLDVFGYSSTEVYSNQLESSKPQNLYGGGSNNSSSISGNSGNNFFDNIFLDTTTQRPILFLLTPGFDPSSIFEKLAKERGKEDHIVKLSLGKDQKQKAFELIKKGKIDGDWVFLQNAHLALDWLSCLNHWMEPSSEEPNINSEFRVWLTSLPDPNFPTPLLENCFVKVTSSPPKGLKESMMHILSEFDENYYENCSRKVDFKKLLFSLMFFHSIITSRIKKYNPIELSDNYSNREEISCLGIGFNKIYKFNINDLESSYETLRINLEYHDQISWPTVKYLISEIHYGGRITEENDLKLLKVFLDEVFKPDIIGISSVSKVNNGGTNENIKIVPEDNLGEYPVPPDNASLQECMEYVKRYPDQTNSKIFGLHENANIIIERKNTSQLLNKLILVQLLNKGIDNSSKIKNKIDLDNENQQFVILNLVKKLIIESPKLLDYLQASKITFQRNEDGSLNSIATFLSQEIQSFNKLINIIQNSLINLKNALEGEDCFSKELQEMYFALKLQKLPYEWIKYSYPSEKSLVSWWKDFLLRCKFIQNWIVNGPPEKYWFTCFFHPRSFLASVIHYFSRKAKIPILQLSIKFSILEIYRNNVISKNTIKDEKKELLNEEVDLVDEEDDLEELMDEESKLNYQKNNGVLIRDLYLEGCSWNEKKKRLEEARLGELRTKLKTVWIEPVLKGDSNDPGGVFSVNSIQSSASISNINDLVNSSTELNNSQEEISSSVMREDIGFAEDDQYYYKCPIYRTSKRKSNYEDISNGTHCKENFIMSVNLHPGKFSKSHWTKRSVALFAEVD